MRRSNPALLGGALDCFAEPVVGRVRATRWLVMTTKIQFRRMTNWLSAEALKLQGPASRAGIASLAANFRRVAANQRQAASSNARCLRKTAPLQAFRSHGVARRVVESKIRCRLKHLSDVPRRSGERPRRGATSNPKLREALKAGSPKRAAPNINATCESCGKLKARNFSCGKRRFFRGGYVAAGNSAKNTPAMVLRKIFRRFAIAR